MHSGGSRRRIVRITNSLTEFEQRRRNVAAALNGAKVDALLVSSPASIRYLTDYAGSNGLVLITPSEEHFFTDPRYGLEATQKITCKVHVCTRQLIDEVASLMKRRRWKQVGFEPAWMNVAQHQRLNGALPSGSRLIPTGNVVEDLRAVKSPAEVAKIRRSVNLNSEAYARTLRRIRAGVREQEIAAELDFQMRVLGAEKTAFDTIVASGARSALPHAHPTAHRVAPNELLLIDMGATLDGYCSDMTRVAFLGTASRQVKQLYRAVLDAQSAALREVRSGVPVAKVDLAARNVLKRHNLDKAFVHSTGHGLGLEIHETPKLGKKEKTKLKTGMVITIEPGVYLEGQCGIRIEDTVLVTENGCQIMTPTSKELVQI
jgi:Xaa-Pro aminopeptidase